VLETSRMQAELHLDKMPVEQPAYFKAFGAYLYTVLHRVEDPVARVLLVGPFASERHRSYLPWVRWARYLAARRIEVLRYDYRGIGESSEAFEEMTFTDWSQDVALLAGWLESQSPRVPLVLHGLELGALLAGRAFHHGTGDALLLWSPPANANQALRSILVRWVGMVQMLRGGDERKSAGDYISQLERESWLEVDGYSWSSRLWQDSFHFAMPAALCKEDTACARYDRPVRLVQLGKEAAPLAKGGSAGYDEARDFTWLFGPNAEWIEDALVLCLKGKNVPGN